MIHLARAVAAWRKRNARARGDVIWELRQHLKPALVLANASPGDINENWRPRFRNDVRALRAAIRVLRAAEKPRKAGRR
jgi:hypothetical protein